MKFWKSLYEKFIRLIVSICHQIPWVLAGIALYFYAHHTFPEKIQSAFGIVEAQKRLAQATQTTAFMKNLISVSNPLASVNYLTSLVQQTVIWSKLSSSQLFANASIAFSLWLIDAFLFLGGIYLVWRTIKTYRFKTHQKESADIVSKELSPYFNKLHEEIQSLREEIQGLKNGKSNPADSTDTGS
ncbi:MAG: hypothetical protein IKQ99_03620 [Alphaproteobacteria bacterium]|nr:hypothetical protein [Alphaproteobacteria bacterium]